jgi:hypothetical protein
MGPGFELESMRVLIMTHAAVVLCGPRANASRVNNRVMTRSLVLTH